MYKNIDFTKNGGFPVTQDTLAFMQEGYNETIAALTSTFGQYVILSGVTDLGSTYSDGWIIYNGELVKFVGGIKTARVAIEETTADETFGDDSVNTVYYTRVAKCVTIGGVLFSELKRFLLVNYASNYTDGVTGVSNIFQSIDPQANAGTTWGNITAKIQKNNGSILLNGVLQVSQVSGTTGSGKSIDYTLADKYRIVVEDDFELAFPVSVRIINNSTLAYIRSENTNGLMIGDSGSYSILRLTVPTLNANERAVMAFNFIGQAFNSLY